MSPARRPRSSARAAWEANAAFWDGRMADGNRTQNELVGPVTDRLIAPRPGMRILDLACGNGVAARRLAAQGAEVVGVDFSRAFLTRARARGVPGPGRIRYAWADLTRPSTLESLARVPFEGAVANMALMDVARLRPLAGWLARHLTRAAPFVVSVCHPAFNTSDATKVLTEVDEGGTLRNQWSVQVSRYLTPRRQRGLGMIGQPVPHVYFDRPLQGILGPFFAAGFVLDALEELAFGRPGTDDRPLSWTRFGEIPQVLVVRFRAPGPPRRADRRVVTSPRRGRSRPSPGR